MLLFSQFSCAALDQSFIYLLNSSSPCLPSWSWVAERSNLATSSLHSFTFQFYLFPPSGSMKKALRSSARVAINCGRIWKTTRTTRTTKWDHFLSTYSVSHCPFMSHGCSRSKPKRWHQFLRYAYLYRSSKFQFWKWSNHSSLSNICIRFYDTVLCIKKSQACWWNCSLLLSMSGGLWEVSVSIQLRWVRIVLCIGLSPFLQDEIFSRNGKGDKCTRFELPLQCVWQVEVIASDLLQTTSSAMSNIGQPTDSDVNW